MNDNVKNAIRDFENGWVVEKKPNENFLSQTMTGDNIPLTARQMGGTERMPGEEVQEETSLIDSVKGYIENAPDTVGAPLTSAFESMTGSISNWAKDKPLYRAVMMTDEEKLLDAQKISGIVGIDAKLLADNQFLYEDAKELADKTAKFAFLNGEPFSADTITKLYPEVDLSDPVNAALALKNAKEILQSRNIIDPPTTITEDIMKAANESWDTIQKSWEAGNKEFEAGELQYRAMSGELSAEEVEDKLKDIEKTEKEYNKAVSNSLIATMVGETVKMGTSMTRMTMKGAEEIIAPLGPSLTMAISQMRPFIPYAATGAAVVAGATGTVAAGAAAAAGALAGALALSKAAVYVGTYRAEAGNAYWDWMQKKDANGRNLYTREQALGHARRVGHMNAFIETASLEMALSGIGKALGPSAALEVIRNKAAMESLIGAGRKAIAGKAAVYAGKQIVKTATPEILEEGLQQAVGDIDENIFGKSGHSTREIMNNALDAMIQAVPASVGMALGGSALAGAGTYRGMRRISKLSKAELKDTVTEFKRENEKSLIQKLMQFREGASLYKKSPEAYRKTLQKQLEDNAMGTIYIDVQTAAENENTHEALNKLVENGTITAKELDSAIKEGKPLELETGKYMQTATPEIHEALSDYTTMDKGEKTIHAIREERQRYKDMVDIVTMTKEKREAAAAQKILDEHFSEDSDKGREDRATASELFSGGIDKLQENYKAMLEEAKTLWGDLSGVGEYQKYMDSKEGGVEFTWTKDKEGFDTSKRISNNETWYRDFYEKHGRAPTQRELYDVAHENAISEYGDKTDEETVAGIREMEAAKKRVESIERIGETIQALKKEDLLAQTLLDPETYDEAYKPLLAQITEAGNKEVKQAARDSALILSKLAENFHKNYGIPLKLAVIEVGKIAGLSPDTYGMAAFDVSRVGVAKVSQFMEKIKARKEAGEAPNKIMYTGKYGVVYGEQQVVHATTDHRGHILTAEQMDDIEEHLNILTNAALSDRRDALNGPYNGKSVVCRVDGDLGSYYVVVEVTNVNGTIWFKTGMAGKKESIDNIIAEHSAGLLTHGDAESTGQNTSAITIDSLPELLGIVKQESLHQMAGERAFNAPLEQLQEAKQMEHEYEAEEIWNKTGWMRGPDGVWRFEIPDLLDRIDTDFMQVVSRTTLSHIYDNSKLYEAYPFLKNIPVRVENISDENKGTKGFADGESIILSRKWLKEDPEAARLTLIHELQHIIQGKAEPEFSKGGNAESAKQAMRDTLDDLKVKLRDARSDEDVNAYVEAREAADKAGDDIEEWFRLGKKAEEIGDKLGADVKDSIDRLFYQIDELEKALKESSDYEAYRRLGGEAEAFMIMDRAQKKDNESMPNYNTPYGSAVVNFGNVEYTLPFMETDKVEEELPAIRERYRNTDEWMKAPDGTPTKLTEHQWLISHSDSFRKWFGDWETVEKYNELFHSDSHILTADDFNRKIEQISREIGKDIKPNADSIRSSIKQIFRALYPATKLHNGYSEPAVIKNHYGETISLTVSAAKEIKRHSADFRSFYLLTHLDMILKDATFLYEEKMDESRIKKLNRTTLAYRYYVRSVVIDGVDCIARIVTRKDRNGDLYLYDGDITSKSKIKEDLSKYLYPGPKPGQNSNKSFFTHSIQDWLSKVKETTDKINENGDVRANIINEFDKERKGSPYYQTALATWEERLKEDTARWERLLDMYAAGNAPTQSMRVMNTPLVLQLLGAKDIPMTMDVSKLSKVLEKHGPQNKEGMTLNIMKQLPKAMADPIMIVTSSESPGRQIEVLELKDENGVNVVVPVQLDARKGRCWVNIITSAYGRTTKHKTGIDHKWFRTNVEQGRLEYVNRNAAYKVLGMEKREAHDLLQSVGVQFSLEARKSKGFSMLRILDERDLVKARKENPSYYQATDSSQYQGSYDRNTNVIELFDGANQSTVIHEGAHMFLSTLENMSRLDMDTLTGYFDGNMQKAEEAKGKLLADLSAIRKWAAFSDEHLAEYKNTALEKEFLQHASDIKEGKEGAEERWIQERFARGFEKYLMDGSAPTKEMQGVFRRFKKWLTDIYKTAKNLGNVELTPEIKDIFDRMLATEDEINAWAAQRKLEAIDKVVDVNSSEMGNLKAWAESVKDKALERAMSYYLHMVKEDAIENFRASIASEDQKMDFLKNLGEENEIYQIEAIYNSDTFPTEKEKKDFLAMSGHTEESLKEKLREAGGTSEERWEAHVEDMVTHYKEEALTPELIQQMAEDILNSLEGLQKKSRIEAMLLEKKVTQYINLVTSMQLEFKRSKDKAKTARDIRKRLGLVSEKETTELDKQSETIAKSEDRISRLEKQVQSLKERLAKAKEGEAKAKEEKTEYKESTSILEGNLHALERELIRERSAREKDKATQKDAEATIVDLSVQLETMVKGLQDSRKAMQFDLELLKEDARNTLGGEKLSHATSWRWWQNGAQIEEGRAMSAAAKNDWAGVAYHKQAQAQCLIMAKEARKNEDEIRRTLHGGGGKVTTSLLNENGMERYGILGILNRISRTDKPVMMKNDARYFVQHMAYMLGIIKKDGILPIDEKGQERAFNWHWLAVEMNPMQAMDNPGYMAEDIIPSWMRQAFDGTEPMKLRDLTMDQFREMAKVMKAVYRLGRREYEGNTLGTSFDKATEEITAEIYDNWNHRKVTPQVKAQTDTAIDRVKGKAHSLVKDITLPEILIERMGKSAYRYFYMPIDKATEHLRAMKQDARKILRANFDTYSRKEWTSMRSKRLYAYGIDDRGETMQWTKEQVIAMALNFGTKSNRQRLIETLWGNESDLLSFLDQTLTDKDWDFVEKVWAHLNSFWGERNKVQNDLYGTPLGKVPGEKFTLKSGRVIHGQYYRIKYDPATSSKAGRNQANDIARMDMENTSAFSLGMGSTKQRAATSGGQKLRLDLDVYVESVNEAMQHIAMREATVDVYKLLTRKEIVQVFELTTGPETIRMLQEWAKDNWHSSIKEMAEWDSLLGRARRRFNFTTMGFRLSTALLNIGNITGMMDRMGAMNALKACWDFYKNPQTIGEMYRFIQNKSTMMNDRRATIDRDMYLQDKIPVGKNESELRSVIEHGKYGVDSLNKNAYWFIQFTDGIFSYPEWLHTYRTALVELEAEGTLSREDMDKEAVRRADKMVRETFGSNETKDQTQFTRDNGILAQMTSFFSYTNLVTNQFIRAGYILYDKGDIRPLLAATWYWWILGAAIETAIRASADDSDDEDKWEKKAIHVFASNGPFAGVPLLREIIPWTVDYFVGKKPFGSAAPDAPAFDMVKHTENFLKAMNKGDYIEAGRGATKAITRSSIPVPDTIVDAFWNLMRMVTTDTDYTVQQFIWKSLWDKSMKAKEAKR